MVTLHLFEGILLFGKYAVQGEKEFRGWGNTNKE